MPGFSETRLPIHMILSALQRQCAGKGIGYFVRHKGDQDRGGVLVILEEGRNQYRLIERARDFEGNSIWRPISTDFFDGLSLQEQLSKHKSRDPDINIIDIEASLAAIDWDVAISDPL